MTFYVMGHQKPEQRAALWLAVNAGSVQEDDDQRPEYSGDDGQEREQQGGDEHMAEVR